MAKSGKGSKQNYAAILKALDPRQAYSVSDIVDFAARKGLLMSRFPGDPGKDRARARRTFSNYSKKLDDSEMISPEENGSQWPSWPGYHWQRRLLPLSPRDILELEEIAKSLALSRLKAKLAQERKMIELRRKVASAQHQIVSLTTKNGLSEPAHQDTDSSNLSASKSQKRPSWLRGGSAFLLAVLAVTTMTITATSVIMDEDPFHILRKYGLAAAREIMPKVPQTLDEIYRQSWMEYLEGEHDHAALGIYSILAVDPVPRYLKGDCHYLLGLIYTQKGQFLAAVGRYNEAYEIYLADHNIANQYVVAVEIANCFAALGQYEETETWLELAWDHYRQDQASNETIKDLGQYYLVRLDLAGGREDYSRALNFAKARKEEAQKTEHRSVLPYALQQVGFWYAVNGCTELAAHYTDLANGAVLGTGDERPLVFNMVNSILIQRNLGFSVKPDSVEAIRAWAKERDDQRLEHILDLTLTIPIKDTGYDCEKESDPSAELDVVSH